MKSNITVFSAIDIFVSAKTTSYKITVPHHAVKTIAGPVVEVPDSIKADCISIDEDVVGDQLSFVFICQLIEDFENPSDFPRNHVS